MCTAITYQPRELYMGRSLDYEASYGEELVVLPRRFPLRFRHGGGSEQGYAILGTAHVADGYPLYYDAVNEKGLGIAGLNFVGNARYAAPQDGRQDTRAGPDDVGPSCDTHLKSAKRNQRDR